jgi:hypothetical protein
MSDTDADVDEDEAFLRTLVLPEEDVIPRRPWTRGFRWFRSPNVVPLERYRAAHPPGGAKKAS